MTAISVIIPTYNRAGLLVEALDSVLAQTRPADEIIVVDDGSTDHTPHRLAPYRPHISLVHQPRRGVSAARNRGIRMARGRWIAFLDSDDLWLPEKLGIQEQYLARHPRCLIVQTDEIWMRNGKRWNPKRYHRKPRGRCFPRLLERCLISPSAVMMSRRLLLDVGLFDESLPACEDYDLWLRIGCRHPIGLIEEPLVVKRGGHPDQLSATTAALDKYRIRALVNLLLNQPLSDPDRDRTLEMLSRKCRIYAQGCARRGKSASAARYRSLPRRIRSLLDIPE